MTSLWIGPDDSLFVGQIGFLIEHSNAIRGSTRYVVRNIPAHTNRSNQPRLHGWCGTDNDVATYGRGMVRVERVANNGRAYVRKLEGSELAAALESMGYPDIDAE